MSNENESFGNKVKDAVDDAGTSIKNTAKDVKTGSEIRHEAQIMKLKRQAIMQKQIQETFLIKQVLKLKTHLEMQRLHLKMPPILPKTKQKKLLITWIMKLQKQKETIN